MKPTGRRPSLRIVLYILMVVQVSIAVSLSGWLVYHYGQKNAQDVAHHLLNEYTTRIEDRLYEFLEIPRLINELNSMKIEIGNLDLNDSNGVERWLHQQVQAFGRAFNFVGYIALARESDGAYVCLYRFADGRYEVDNAERGGASITTWSIRSDGSHGEVIRSTPDYDPRKRPWYRAAVSAGKPTWTDVYVWFGANTLCLDTVRPVYDDKHRPLGVLETGFTLSQISEYLRKLEIGRSGRTFIVDRQGRIVAASSGAVFHVVDGQSQRVAATDSADPLIRAAAKHMESIYPDLGSLQGRHTLELIHEDATVYLQVTEVAPSVGLDWIIVAAVPEGDFMEHVDANIKTTILLCIACIVFAILLGFLTVRWIAQPLMALTEKATRIKEGDLEVKFTPQSRDEIGTLTETMGDMVTGLKERETIRDAFGRYVTPQLAEQVLSQPDALKPGGSLQTITILMSDLRGFTKLSAKLGPAAMVSLLNRYLARMTEVIVEHEGMINEFIGDAILVLFGAPSGRPDDTERAVRCAIEMQLALLQFNQENEAEGIPALKMGIGINTGDVILGNIGSQQRVKYGVVGDAVNMTGRIESLTVGTQILLSLTTYEQVTDLVEVGDRIDVSVKGRAEELTVFELRGIHGDSRLRMPDLEEQTWSSVDLQAEIYLLAGKTVEGEAIVGRVVRMGGKQLEIESAHPFEVLQNLKLRVLDSSGSPGPDIYGKITSIRDCTSAESDRRRCCTVTLT